MMGGGGGGLDMVGWLLFALVVLIGVVSVALTLIRRSGRRAAPALLGDDQRSLQRTSARKLLDDRYAAGEIDSDEYRERVITLEQNG